ncbi:hypothetical protein BJ742DRAFT_840707 [Cladochytrium replicatum]|nr:hypothetical protein BJ742DRAFT_840707 [Cladochytrium replicatum]
MMEKTVTMVKQVALPRTTYTQSETNPVKQTRLIWGKKLGGTLNMRTSITTNCLRTRGICPKITSPTSKWIEVGMTEAVDVGNEMVITETCQDGYYLGALNAYEENLDMNWGGEGENICGDEEHPGEMMAAEQEATRYECEQVGFDVPVQNYVFEEQGCDYGSKFQPSRYVEEEWEIDDHMMDKDETDEFVLDDLADEDKYLVTDFSARVIGASRMGGMWGERQLLTRKRYGGGGRISDKETEEVMSGVRPSLHGFVFPPHRLH